MARLLSMHGKCVGEAASNRTKPVSPLDGVIVGAVLEALLQIGLTEEQAIAQLLGVDRSQWSKQKTGQGGHHMSVQRLERLSPDFLTAFTKALARRANLRLLEPDARRQALAKAIRAMGEAVEALDDSQLPLFSERVG